MSKIIYKNIICFLHLFLAQELLLSKSLTPPKIKNKFFDKVDVKNLNKNSNKKINDKNKLIEEENLKNNSNNLFDNVDSNSIGFIDDIININSVNQIDNVENFNNEEKNEIKEKSEIDKKEITENDILNALTKIAEKKKNDGNFDQAENCYKIIKEFAPDIGEKKLQEIKKKIEEKTEIDEYKRDIKILFESVKSGNYDDAYKLGMIFLSNNDILHGIKILSFAAQKGNAEAAHQLAIMFQNGESVTQNFNIAQKWYVIGAKNGHPKCMYKLAEILQNVIKNNETDDNKSLIDKVISFKIEAAAKGHIKSAIDLGFYYSSINDHVLAQKYFMLANEKLSQNKTIKINAKELVEYNITAEKSLQ